MDASDPVISLRDINVSYRKRAGFLRWKRFWALKGVSFDIYHGETLGVVGKNGVGKSTLLRTLAGIIEPDQGAVKRNDCSISLLGLQVGFIPHLTGRENAVLSGMLMGLSRAEIEGRIAAIIEFSGLAEFIDQPVRSYSIGMRARLGFSTAIQIDADVLLVDEVLGVGDAEFRVKSAAAMKRKIRSNKTVVLVSHNANTIRELCDRVLWIEKGKVIEIGESNQIMDKYER